MSVAVVGLKGRKTSTKHNPTRNRSPRLLGINIVVRSEMKVDFVWVLVFVLLIQKDEMVCTNSV